MKIDKGKNRCEETRECSTAQPNTAGAIPAHADPPTIAPPKDDPEVEATLPFAIMAEKGGYGKVQMTAIKNGEKVAFETYRLGDGSEREQIAEQWAERSDLKNGFEFTAEMIARELEAAEANVGSDDSDEDSTSDDSEEVVRYVRDNLHVELAWNQERGGPDFLLRDGVANPRVIRVQKFEGEGGNFVPPSNYRGIVTPGYPHPGCVFVPSDAEAWQDESGEKTQALLDDLRAFINHYVELPGNSLDIAVMYVFFTWVHDAFAELPYLAFRTADYGCGKSRALETVGSVCYRQMLAGGGSTAAATRRIVHKYRGTLVADEFDQNHKTELFSSLTRILNQGFQKGRPMLICEGENNEPTPYDVFGPKIFALRGWLGDDAIESRTISVWMKPRTRDDVPLNLPKERFEREALNLRNRLLSWRFAMYPRFADGADQSLASRELEDRGNQIGLPLMTVAKLVGGEGLVESIVAALKHQQKQIAEERADSLAGEVLQAVMDHAEREHTDIVRPGEIATRLNRRRSDELGEEIPLRDRVTAHRVGRILKNELEFPYVSRDGSGARYQVDSDRMKSLLERFDVVLPETSPSSSSPRTSVPPPGSVPAPIGPAEPAEPAEVVDVDDDSVDSDERT